MAKKQNRSPAKAPSSVTNSAPGMGRPEQLIRYEEASFFSGPVPSPEALQAYASVDPTFPERLMRAFEKQSEHRQSLESKVVNGNQTDQRIGMVIGGILALSFLSGGVYVAVSVDAWAGASIVGANLASIVGVFVYGKHAQAKKLEAERQML